jgi:hypothetical protein
LLAATFYQGYPDRNRKLWNIVSTKRYTPYAGAAGYNIFNMVVGYNLF